MDFVKLYNKNANSIFGKQKELLMLCRSDEPFILISLALILVRDRFVSERLIIDDSIETTAVKIHTNVGAIYVINSYVRNDSKDKSTPFQHETVLMKNLAVIRSVMSTMNHKTDTVLVLGDFNLKTVRWKKNGNRMRASNLNQVKSHYSVFIEAMSEMGFSQINAVPNDNGRYLDLIFTTNSATFKHCSLSTEAAQIYLPNTESWTHKETVVSFEFVS